MLVADDHKLTREMIGHVLSALECKRVRFVPDGAAAFVEIVNAPPDLAIVDFHMPLDGLQLLNKVRRAANSPDSALPVIVMTSLTDRKRIEALRDAGATEIIAKPFTAAAVLSRIAAVIDSPRPFIATRAFIGPCRRRGRIRNTPGPIAARATRPWSTSNEQLQPQTPRGTVSPASPGDGAGRPMCC
ncbi:MAG: response regulator [Caulobacteraceae bacterium]